MQNRGDHGGLRVALMNYLEAEDDGHGKVPMEVGAMKGKKETEARRAVAKESLATVWESTTQAMSTAKGTITAKARKRKRKERQRKRTRKRRETSAKLVKATAEHVANGDTRRVSVGKDTCKLWRKFRVLLRVQWHQVQQPHRRLRRQQRLFKNSMMSRNQDGSSA